MSPFLPRFGVLRLFVATFIFASVMALIPATDVLSGAVALVVATAWTLIGLCLTRKNLFRILNAIAWSIAGAFVGATITPLCYVPGRSILICDIAVPTSGIITGWVLGCIWWSRRLAKR